MQDTPSLLIGADPELFLRKGNRLISSIGRIGGTKLFPKKLGLKDGFYVQEDNVAVEFNIPPAATQDEFVQSITYAKDTLSKLADNLGLSLHIVASAKFPETQLRDPRAQEFFCTPDFCAWNNGEVNPKPKAGSKRLRSSGGHVHFGYPNSGDERFRLRLIQANDFFLGVPSVIMDADTKRRQLYGKAGCFRPTSYGVEYRTLSNFWLLKEKYTAWVYQNAVRAFEFAKSPSNWTVLDIARDHIVRAINKSDEKAAATLIEDYQIPVCI